MDKYRVLTKYPKQITNSGRIVTLQPKSKVYLKKDSQVIRLIKMGMIKPIIEMPKKKKAVKVVKVREEQPSVEPERKERKPRRRHRKNKGEEPKNS